MRINSIGLMNSMYGIVKNQISMKGSGEYKPRMDKESCVNEYARDLVKEGYDPIMADEKADMFERCLESVENH